MNKIDTEAISFMNVYFVSPFGTRISTPKRYYMSAEAFEGNYRDIEKAKMDLFPLSLIKDSWIAFLITAIIVLIKYISMRVNIKIE